MMFAEAILRDGPEPSQRPMMQRIRSGNSSPLQLVLPFTEVALYRESEEVVGTFKMSMTKLSEY